MLKTYESQGDHKSMLVIKTQLDEMQEDVQRLTIAKLHLTPSSTSSSIPEDDSTKLKMKYSYKALDETQLTVKEGDILTLIPEDSPSSDWIKAQAANQIGYVPRLYVDILDKKAKVLYDFQAKSETELSLQGTNFQRNFF
jgi:hypothetical protein